PVPVDGRAAAGDELRAAPVRDRGPDRLRDRPRRVRAAPRRGLVPAPPPPVESLTSLWVRAALRGRPRHLRSARPPAAGPRPPSRERRTAPPRRDTRRAPASPDRRRTGRRSREWAPC